MTIQTENHLVYPSKEYVNLSVIVEHQASQYVKAKKIDRRVSLVLKPLARKLFEANFHQMFVSGVTQRLG